MMTLVNSVKQNCKHERVTEKREIEKRIGQLPFNVCVTGKLGFMKSYIKNFYPYRGTDSLFSVTEVISNVSIVK